MDNVGIELIIFCISADKDAYGFFCTRPGTFKYKLLHETSSARGEGGGGAPWSGCTDARTKDCYICKQCDRHFELTPLFTVAFSKCEFSTVSSQTVPISTVVNYNTKSTVA